jgi:hypothetical protein
VYYAVNQYTEPTKINYVKITTFFFVHKSLFEENLSFIMYINDNAENIYDRLQKDHPKYYAH